MNRRGYVNSIQVIVMCRALGSNLKWPGVVDLCRKPCSSLPTDVAGICPFCPRSGLNDPRRPQHLQPESCWRLTRLLTEVEADAPLCYDHTLQSGRNQSVLSVWVCENTSAQSLSQGVINLLWELIWTAGEKVMTPYQTTFTQTGQKMKRGRRKNC